MVRQPLKGDQLPLFAKQIVPGGFAIANLGIGKIRCEVLDVQGDYAMLLFSDGAKPWFPIAFLEPDTQPVENSDLRCAESGHQQDLLLRSQPVESFGSSESSVLRSQPVEKVREQGDDFCSLTNGDSADSEQAPAFGGGTVEIKTIKGRQYRYLRFRQEGKLKSKYLGKVSAS